MFKIEIEGFGDLANLYKEIDNFGSLGAKQAQACFQIATSVQNEWRRVLTAGHSEVGLKNPQFTYSKNIRMKKVGQYHFRVESRHPHSGWMETQEQDFDMKKTHPYGKKSRVSAKGVPYLIVPLMHLRPNKGGTGMPSEVFKSLKDLVKDKGKSSVSKSNAYTSVNANKEDVFRPSYNWGGRTSGFTGELAKYNGMVDMETSTITSGGKTKNSSKAFTFRVISANSPSGSWIRKARPVILPTVLKNIEREVSDYVENVIMSDLNL